MFLSCSLADAGYARYRNVRQLPASGFKQAHADNSFPNHSYQAGESVEHAIRTLPRVEFRQFAFAARCATVVFAGGAEKVRRDRERV